MGSSGVGAFNAYQAACMLVDVARMRNQGEKLSIALLKTTAVVRGHLGVFVRRDMHRGCDVVCAMLEGDLAGQFRLPVLDHMRLTRLRGESFVLVGFKEVQQRRTSDVFPQAWWCRVVCEATGVSALADDAEVESV
jgi:hypothetical protein